MNSRDQSQMGKSQPQTHVIGAWPPKVSDRSPRSSRMLRLLLQHAPPPLAPRSPWTVLASRSLCTPVSRRGGQVRESSKENQRREIRKQFLALPAALDDFATSTGHYVVPRYFPIPQKGEAAPATKPTRKIYVNGLESDVNAIAWRDEVRGMNLGAKLMAFLDNVDYQRELPEVVEKLEERGFQRGETFMQNKWRLETMPALRVYHEIHGHTRVPISFTVPRDDDRWPVATRGSRLGIIVREIRDNSHKLTPQQLNALQTLDFSLNVRETMWSENVLPSLEMYARIHGNCFVPASFVVPHSEPWPRKVWGYSLGATVAAIRSSGRYAPEAARDAKRLEAIDFVWNYTEYQWKKKILPSLEVFQKLHGHCSVPCAFIVPSEAPWPEEAWGLPLGTTVSSLRSAGTYDEYVNHDADRLEALGFVWDTSEEQWSNVIMPSLVVYAERHGDCFVPQSFVVPSEEPWPEKAWGIRLGNTVRRIRSKVAFVEQTKRDADRLDAIGFSWDARQDWWDRAILPALEMFFQVYGHSDVPTNFVVPSGEPWPRHAWSMRLGSTVNQFRTSQTFLEQREQDQERLAAINLRVRRH